MEVLRDEGLPAYMGFIRDARNRRKGRKGEKMVRRALSHQGFFSPFHRTVHGIIIADRHGNTHEIDHIDIRRNGIFCIETKSISGRIEGKATDELWFSYLPGRKHEHRNPLRQNAVHARVLEELLGRPVSSIVVFVQDNAPGVEGTINLSSLAAYLRSYRGSDTLSRREVKAIRRIIREAGSGISHRSHVRAIRKSSGG